MTHNKPDPESSIADLEVSFSYLDARQLRCLLTFKSYNGSTIRFAWSQVDVRHPEQLRLRVLSPQEAQLVASVRQAPTSVYTKTALMRLTPHYVMFGPYPVKGIAEHVVTVVRAICGAYVQYGTIRLTFTANWPAQPLSETLARLSQPNCADFLANYRVLKTLR